MRSSGLMLGVGLAIGALAGAGGMYLAVGRSSAPPAVVATAPPADGGVAAPAHGKKKLHHGGGGGASAPDDQDPPTTLSDADLRMIWKGDAVERPPATIDLSSSAEARSLDGGEIQSTIDAGGEAVRTCVVQAIGIAPFEGDITLKLLVDGDGKVTKSRVHGPAFAFDHGLYGCMDKAAGRLRFPAVGGFTVVTVPFPVSVE